MKDFVDHQMLYHKKTQTLMNDLIKAEESDTGLSRRFDVHHFSPECFPIEVPPNDPSFTVDMLNFARSEFREDCDGVRQQLNFHSSYLDASAVYGTNTQESRALRQYSGGLLKMNSQMLPVDYDDASCILSRPLDPENNYCGRAGDIRVNEQPGLAALHTLFVREHNRIAGNLSAMNPTLTDEVLFQEARKIVAAEMQLVTYKEFLPAVIGPEAMNTYGFTISNGFNTDTYDPSVDASIQNAFAAAILRFGHTLVPNEIGMVRRNYTEFDVRELSDTFFNPEMYHSNGNKGPDDILRWLSIRKSAKSDKQIENSVRDELFKDSEGGRIDLAALNIQRGRDHGLPGYNEWRRHCGLSTATSFETLADHTVECIEKLKRAYKCVDDIDLFTGALTENRRSNSLLGPVQQCILGEQFRALKNGDRFYFEREDSEVGFTEPQLRNIQSLSLASIFCANTDSMGIQEHMFMLPPKTQDGMFYEIRTCETLPQLDFSLWRVITKK